MKRLNILLIGGANSLTNQLIRQFNKEGHRVSLLTGSPNRGQSYARVFERYDFSYTSEAIPEVFNSVSPDVTVFTGTYDANFSWEDERRDAVAYVSAVVSILSSYTSVGKGRLIYLSTDSVYEANNGSVYTEEDAVNAENTRGAAFVQAEDICRRFMENMRTDIVIARLSGVYHAPGTPEDMDDAVSEFCVRYLRDGNVPMPDDQVMMPLAENDAVFFLSRLALAPEHRFSVYHIASGKTIRVGELKTLIEEAAQAAGFSQAGGGTGSEDAPGGIAAWILRRRERRAGVSSDAPANRRRGALFTHLKYPQAILEASRFRDEFGMNRLTDFESDIRSLVANVIQHRDAFLRSGSDRASLHEQLKKEVVGFLRTLVPFAENILCFALFFLLNTRLDASRYFSRIDFYLIYVLLFAIVYGQHQAILSAFLASAGFLFTQLRSGSGGSELLDYNMYVWIAQLFIIGLVVGYLKDRLTDQKSEAMHDYEHMTRQIDDVREINESNVRVKGALQTEVINQNDSIGKIYEITSTLDKYNSEDVFFQAMNILRRIMGSDDIALYTVSNHDYARLFSATSELAASLGNSIRYRELTELYDTIKDGKPYINRRLRADYPMMACAIREGEDLRTIIMIWKLPWEKMTLGQAGILTVTSMLIQNAVLRAHRFLDVTRNERFIGDTRILKPEAFASVLEAYRNAAKQNLTQFTVLRIDGDGSDAVSVETGNRAAACLRPDDYLGFDADGKLYVLLPNTSLKNAAVALSRLQSSGVNASVAERMKDEAAE